MSAYDHSAHVELPVEYLTTSGCDRTVVHFFQTVVNPDVQGRVFILVDHPTVKVDFETAMHRCVEVSKISSMAVPPDVANGLMSAVRTKYDKLLGKLAMVDFVRMVGGIYRPNDAEVPIVEMAEGQMIGARVVVRHGSLIKQSRRNLASSGGPGVHSIPVAASPQPYQVHTSPGTHVTPPGGAYGTVSPATGGGWIDPTTGAYVQPPAGGPHVGRTPSGALAAHRSPPPQVQTARHVHAPQVATGMGGRPMTGGYTSV